MKMKKIITMIIAAVMACSLCAATAFAAEATAPEGAAPVIVAQQPGEAAPAPAEAETPKTFETADGILSMTLPKDQTNWAVVQDPNAWFTISNGTDLITAKHVANGDPLPATNLANDKYAEIFEITYSTKNEVFVITGCAKDAQKMPAIRDAVCSFKVLKYDTLEKKEAPKPVQVREVAETLYCKTPEGVNVRQEPNTSCAVIGGIHFRDQVDVTGYVTENGADTGWLQIRYNGGIGYAHSANFSKDKPSDRTGKTIDLYAPEGGGLVVTVYELTDGRYVDDNNVYYTKASDTEFFDDKENKWVLPEYFEDNPVGQIFTDFYQDMVNEATGAPVTVRLMTDGRYINEDTQVIYNMEGGGGPHMYGEDGSVLVVPEEYNP